MSCRQNFTDDGTLADCICLAFRHCLALSLGMPGHVGFRDHAGDAIRRPPADIAANAYPRWLDGTRLTINTALSSKQALWNLRSAYNVAALNCQNPQHLTMAAQYAAFLKANKKLLASVYKDLDKEFKQVHGAAGYIQKREIYQTQVYNYFAFTPVMPAFCDTMFAVGQGLNAVPSKSLEAQAPFELAKLEKLYQDFFVSYDKYRSDLAIWEAQYGSHASSLTSAAPATAQP